MAGRLLAYSGRHGQQVAGGGHPDFGQVTWGLGARVLATQAGQHRSPHVLGWQAEAPVQEVPSMHACRGRGLALAGVASCAADASLAVLAGVP